MRRLYQNVWTIGVVAIAGVVLAASGCRQPEDPRGFSRERPPADRLDRRDRGLQSLDVVAAADQMATSLLSDPAVTQAPERMLVVVDRAENLTTTVDNNLDIFLRQLRAQVGRQGRDRIQLIEQRRTLRDLQSRELEPVPGDEFAGPVPGGTPGPAGIQPNYSLYVQVRDLPGRGTNFYQFDFTLTDLRTREVVWNDIYDVRVRR